MKKKGRIILLVVAIGVSIGLAYGLLRVAPPQRIGTNLQRIGENLLKNSNFEVVHRSGRIKTWLEDRRGGWSVSTEGAYQGENCMQATVGWSWLSQEIRVKPDKYYLLKAYLKSDIPISGEGGGGNAFLGFDYLDRKGQVIEGDYGIINTTYFWQQEIQQIYAPPETNKIRVKLAKRQGEGSVWFDELELEQIPAVLVLNSSFEILDEKGRPRYWLEDRRGGWSVSTEGAYQGENCMQATVGWSWLSQEIRVKSEEDYTFQVYSRSDIIIPRGREEWNAFLALECLNKEGKVVRENMIQLNIPYSWKSQVISVYAPPETNKIRVKLAKRQGGGSVWFDEPKIVKLTWYMESTFLRRIAEDKPFFIFYFSVYFILLVLLLRLILKRQPSPQRQRVLLGKKSKESQN